MKKIIRSKVYWAIAIIVMLSCTGCHINNNNAEIAISETPETYQLNASFSKSKTSKVRAYLDRSLNSNASMSFANAEIDATITLDNATKFYVKSYPGTLKIRFNKKENSEEALAKIKSTCEGLKTVINE